MAPGVTPALVPPCEGPLLQVVENYMKGQMLYLEFRQRSDLHNRFDDLKRFLKTEYPARTPPIAFPPHIFSNCNSPFRYANNREFMREQSVLTHISLVNELAKALKALRAEASSPKPDPKP